MTRRRLVVASASPRRHELLTRAGYDFTVVPADIDESAKPAEPGPVYVERLARAKAEAVAAGLISGSGTTASDPIVLGADTIVELDGILLGKPAGHAEAVATLRRLRGREHRVITAVAIVADGHTTSATRTTTVRFRQLSNQEIDDYVATGEPLGKAGSYAIQGLGGAFVEEIVGSYDNVVGLPVDATSALLRQAGLGD